MECGARAYSTSIVPAQLLALCAVDMCAVRGTWGSLVCGAASQRCTNGMEEFMLSFLYDVVVQAGSPCLAAPAHYVYTCAHLCGAHEYVWLGFCTFVVLFVVTGFDLLVRLAKGLDCMQ